MFDTSSEVSGATPQTVPSSRPTTRPTGRLLATVARGNPDDGRAAISAARPAFDDGPWPSMTPKERARILHAVADAVDAHRDELALLETRDGGTACVPRNGCGPEILAG